MHRSSAILHKRSHGNRCRVFTRDRSTVLCLTCLVEVFPSASYAVMAAQVARVATAVAALSAACRKLLSTCLHGLADSSSEPDRVAALQKAQATAPSEPVTRREMPGLHLASVQALVGLKLVAAAHFLCLAFSWSAGVLQCRFQRRPLALPRSANRWPEQLQETQRSSSSTAQIARLAASLRQSQP